jgi:predicted phage terminase large subunit-like protein
VVIMQRIHEKDVSGWILENGGGRWCYLRLPLHYDADNPCETEIGWSDPRTEHGELLWPARYDESFCVALAKTLGPLRAAGQLEQTPYPADGTEFKSEWLENRYSRLVVAEMERFILSLDASFKGEATSDWCVLGLIAKKGPRYYHCGQIRAKMDYPTLRRRVTEYHSSIRALGIPLSTVLIEDKANGSALIAELGRSLSGVVPYNPKDSKLVRYRAISGILSAGQFFLPEVSAVFVLADGSDVCISADFVSGFEAELLAIPNGAHDDQADMLAQAILYLESCGTPEPAGSTFEEAPQIDVYAPERAGRLFR